MNNIEKLKPFIEEYTDEFYQMIEDIRNYLRNNNKEYYPKVPNVFLSMFLHKYQIRID